MVMKNKQPQQTAVLLACAVFAGLIIILLASIVLSNGLVGFQGLGASLAYALVASLPLGTLCFLALRKTMKETGRPA